MASTLLACEDIAISLCKILVGTARSAKDLKASSLGLKLNKFIKEAGSR